MQRSWFPVILFSVMLIAACGSDELGNSGQPTPGTPAAVVEPTETQSEADATVPCDYGIYDDIEQIDTIDQLAWYSHQIVVGTVTENLGSRKVEGTGPAPEVDFHIVTDYLVQVEDRLRGSDAVAGDPTVTIESYGGTVDDCTMTWHEWPPFEVGDRALFFLRDFEESDQPAAYQIFGRQQGYWAIDDAGLAAPPGAVHLLPERRPVPIDQLTGLVRASLLDGPPDDNTYLMDWYFVPLDEAPMIPPSSRVIQITGSPGELISGPTFEEQNIKLVAVADPPLISMEEAMQIISEAGVSWGLGGEWEGKPVTVTGYYGLATFGYQGPGGWLGVVNIPLPDGSKLDHIEDRPMWIITYSNTPFVASGCPDCPPPPDYNNTIYTVDAQTRQLWFVWGFVTP